MQTFSHLTFHIQPSFTDKKFSQFGGLKLIFQYSYIYFSSSAGSKCLAALKSFIKIQKIIDPM